VEVTYIDHLGDDLRVVNAARVSFKKESKELEKPDQKLIFYLAKHGHWTPFSHCQITLREKVPIFVARQRFKHMVGFTYNEVSRRYVDDAPEFFMPEVWRNKPEGSVKQGSEGVNKDTEHWTQRAELLYAKAESLYRCMLKSGVAPEMARMILPQGMYTEYYVTGSLYAWARAYNLRVDSHAQKEIQDLAKMWNEAIQPLFPVSWEELTNG
jgi:thymidylate synthase (FAD)